MPTLHVIKQVSVYVYMQECTVSKVSNDLLQYA